MNATTILVVDDEPGVALLCKRILTRAGFTVTIQTDPHQALDYLKRYAVDLLLVDIRMPEVDGFEVITVAQHHQPDIAVLVMTGFGTVETAIRALRQGVDGLILKPFEQGDELIQAVKQALEDKQAKRDVARMHTLRPLFDVTEPLLAETRPDRLLDLIVNAICGHLRCSHAGYYQYSTDDGYLHLLAGHGKTLPDEQSKQDGGLVGRADTQGVPLCVSVTGPGDPVTQKWLIEYGLGSLMLIPVSRLNMRSVIYAGRDENEAPFHEADMEMFRILARQAVVAMENARLYAELRDYVKRVEESQQALLQAEKMAAAGRLTASIAHEINNPLQAVRNCLHLAEREDLIGAKRQEYLDLAKSELDRLMTTVQRMLDFYRPGAASPQSVDISDLLNHILGLMSQQLTQRGIRVVTDLPPNLPTVMAASSQIQQVFINLILNASDAMMEGGDLHIRARRSRGGIEIFFQDSGPGVPMEFRPKIFEPFISTKEGGTGLGLTVSYNIVTAHGGILDLVAGNEMGACFRVFLPTGGKGQ